MNDDDAVVSAPSHAELNVHLALDVHEDDAAGEADGDDDELDPEGPVEVLVAHLLGGALDEHVERPHDACDHDQVERHRAEDLATLDVVDV